MWAVIRPTTRAVALGEKHLALGVVEPGVALAVEELAALEAQAAAPTAGRSRRRRYGKLDELLEVGPC